MLIKLDAIKIEGRHRKDMGDIASLAESISTVGLLHPPVVLPDDTLVAGQRRIEAFKLLKRDSIPVTVAKNLDDALNILRAQRDENTCRKDYTPSEAVANGAAIEAIERKEAKARQVVGGKVKGEAVGKLPQADKGRATSKVAAAVGVKRRTYEKAKAVVAAAKAEPEKFSKLVEDMDRTGRVDGPFKRLKVIRQAEEIKRAPAPLPKGPFPVIVIDPPWPYELRKVDPSHRATHPYPQMSLADLCAMPIGKLAAPDCILWLWTTNHHMREAFTVLDAWGFEPKTILTWGKDRMGRADWLRSQTEHCIMAVRGKPIVTLTSQTTLLNAPMREHSRKPDEFFAFVESLCPAPPGGYASIFEHCKRGSWVLWENDALTERYLPGDNVTTSSATDNRPAQPSSVTPPTAHGDVSGPCASPPESAVCDSVTPGNRVGGQVCDDLLEIPEFLRRIPDKRAAV